MIKIRWWVAASFLVLPLLSLLDIRASSFGITGYTGNPATGGFTCNECHEGGVAPEVTIVGPTLVQAGATHTYTLTIGGGQERAGGLGVSVTGGTLSVADPGTYLLNGEIVQAEPRPVSPGTFEASWSFDWTAPPAAATVTIYGAGNSVNLQAGPNGDLATVATLTIDVEGGGGTPGEVSAPGDEPLRVTAFDHLSGQLDLSYGVACDSTDNNIYFGPLDQVAATVWTGEVCGIGTGGSLSGFDPGSGSSFFVVVATKDAAEGSYGRSRAVDGAEQERSPFTGNTCGQTQDLTASCDLPATAP